MALMLNGLSLTLDRGTATTTTTTWPGADNIKQELLAINFQSSLMFIFLTTYFHAAKLHNKIWSCYLYNHMNIGQAT